LKQGAEELDDELRAILQGVLVFFYEFERVLIIGGNTNIIFRGAR
jgi:hypothetical protein